MSALLALARLPGGEMRAAARLLGQAGHRRPEQPGVADRVGVDLVGAGSAGPAPSACGRSTAESCRAGRSRRTSPVSGTRRGSSRSGCRHRGRPARGGRRCRTGRRRRRRSARARSPSRAERPLTLAALPPRNFRTSLTSSAPHRSAGDRCRRRSARWRGRQMAAT